ncbi:hypothetical protein STEG23_014796, partial [Scotinomys teguina]
MLFSVPTPSHEAVPCKGSIIPDCHPRDKPLAHDPLENTEGLSCIGADLGSFEDPVSFGKDWSMNGLEVITITIGKNSQIRRKQSNIYPILFVYVVYYIDRFLYVEPSLHPWDEAYLVMLDNFFDVFLEFSNFVEYRFLKYDVMILWISSLSVMSPFSFLILLIRILSPCLLDKDTI